MRALAKSVATFVVLAACLPTHGEILVYKCTHTGPEFKETEGEWEVKTAKTGSDYLVLNVSYDDYAITQAEVISYWRNPTGKWYEQESVELELVRVPSGNKVQWIIMAKEADLNEEEELVGGGFLMTAGSARNRTIGTGNTREVASRLSGYSVWDRVEDGGRLIEMSKESFAFYAAWTYWANGEDKGHQDFDATVQMITESLTAKGYTEAL